MAMPKLPFIQWRVVDGCYQPRFRPSSREREFGFPGCDLRHEGRGPWFTLDEVRSWLYGADGRSGVYAEILKCRASGKPRNVAGSVAPRGRTVEHLLRHWLNTLMEDTSDERLAETSLDSYRKDVEALIWQPEDRDRAKARRNAERAGVAFPERAKEPFVAKPLAAIGPPEVKAQFNYIKLARGHHQALHCMAAFSSAWTWGQTSTYWRLGLNPRHQVELKRPDGRIRIVSAPAIVAMVAIGDDPDVARFSVGDSILLGLFMGQRQNDRLALADRGLIDGRRRFQQSKTRRVVEIKQTPRLAERMAQARIRGLECKLALKLDAPPATIVFDEATGGEYTANAYSHRYDDIRLVAAHGWLQGDSFAQARQRAEQLQRTQTIILEANRPWRHAPCPDVMIYEGRWMPARDQDLRDTCVTLLYRAGATLMQICDVTGHSYQAVKTIVDHYLARDPASADVAIDKMVAYMEQTGMAV